MPDSNDRYLERSKHSGDHAEVAWLREQGRTAQFDWAGYSRLLELDRAAAQALLEHGIRTLNRNTDLLRLAAWAGHTVSSLVPEQSILPADLESWFDLLSPVIDRCQSPVPCLRLLVRSIASAATELAEGGHLRLPGRSPKEEERVETIYRLLGNSALPLDASLNAVTESLRSTPLATSDQGLIHLLQAATQIPTGSSVENLFLAVVMFRGRIVSAGQDESSANRELLNAISLHVIRRVLAGARAA